MLHVYRTLPKAIFKEVLTVYCEKRLVNLVFIANIIYSMHAVLLV